MSNFPERLGSHYQRDTKLGQGGMGVVYRYRGVMRPYVAVKALPPDVSGDPEWQERLMCEAKLLAEIEDHTNIALALHLEGHDGRTYLVMEYVPGDSLAEVLRGGPIDLGRAINICRQIAEAISAAHSQRVLHLDVKPGNVMVTPRGKVKLLDFGLARRWIAADQPTEGGEATDLGALQARAEATRFHGGTPGYMSPEQYVGRVEQRSDIWSFGCVLYECLTGAAAFPGDDRAERRRATEEDEPNFHLLNLLPERVPESLVVLLRQCLCRGLQDRPRDMESIAQVLRSLEASVTEGATRPTHNLPHPLEPFVGRARELSELQGLLKDNRLLTLHGLGGSGKTRLAMELGRSLGEGSGETRCYPDGVWLVELESIRDPDHLPPQLANVLIKARALPPALSSAPLPAMIEMLRARCLLLVIDNCEHLHEAVRDLLDQLLRESPRVDVIATSRHPLNAEGERLWPIPGLTVPDERATDPADIAAAEAVQLFVDTAARACGSFELTPSNAVHVADICRKCEGLPLLIRLAASFVRTRDVGQIAAHLEQVLEHREGLEARMEASSKLLSPRERTLLGRLTIFRGRWELEAAEAICGDGGGSKIRGEPVAEALSCLVEHSLVQFDAHGGTGRYRVPDTVRVYAEKRLLNERSVPALRKRHLDYFCSVAADAEAAFNAGEQERSLERIELEYDNLRAALEFSTTDRVHAETGMKLAVHLHRFWYVRDHYREGREWLERLLEHRDREDLLQLRAYNAFGILAGAQGEFATAQPAYEHALNIARTLGDQRREAGMLTNLGLLLEQRAAVGEERPSDLKKLLSRARGHLETALELYRALGDRRGEAWGQLNLGVVAKLQDRYGEAVERLEKALPTLVENHDDERVAATKQNLGEMSCQRGHCAECVSMLGESLAISGKLLDVKTGSRTLLWLGVALAGLGEWWRAAVLVAAGESLQSQVDAPRYWIDTAQVKGLRNTLERELDVSANRRAEALGASMRFQEAVAFVFEYLKRQEAA